MRPYTEGAHKVPDVRPVVVHFDEPWPDRCFCEVGKGDLALWARCVLMSHSPSDGFPTLGPTLPTARDGVVCSTLTDSTYRMCIGDCDVESFTALMRKNRIHGRYRIPPDKETWHEF